MTILGVTVTFGFFVYVVALLGVILGMRSLNQWSGRRVSAGTMSSAMQLPVLALGLLASTALVALAAFVMQALDQ